MDVKILNKTKSLCPVCLSKINANVIEKENKIIVSKKCSKHGKFECFHAWDDPFLYKEFMRISKKKREYVKDSTLNLTSKCNMNCSFCFATVKNKLYEPESSVLIEKSKNWGEGCILLYGGEPTLRKDIFKIIKEIKNIGLKVVLLTNGLKLDKKFVKKLETAGLNQGLLQFDSLSDEVNIKMRGRKLLKEKLRAIKNLSETSISLTLFVVLIKGVNENQIDEIISFAGRNSDKIKTVIFTPVSPEGDSKNFRAKHMFNDEIFNKIETEFNIKKEDFIDCTDFDITFSNFLYKLGIKRKSSAPCEALCYVLVNKDKLIPFNKLIELKEFTKILDDIINNEKSRGKAIASLFTSIFKRKLKINILLLPFLFQVLSSITIAFFNKRTMKNKFNKSFGIIVNPSQDRYNIDYNFINKCNLYSDTIDNKFIPFCENNIISTKPKNPNKLNKTFFSNHFIS